MINRCRYFSIIWHSTNYKVILNIHAILFVSFLFKLLFDVFFQIDTLKFKFIMHFQKFWRSTTSQRKNCTITVMLSSKMFETKVLVVTKLSKGDFDSSCIIILTNHLLIKYVIFHKLSDNHKRVFSKIQLIDY